MNREKRSRPSNTVAVGVNGGVGGTVVGDGASVIVISTCGVFVSGREVADGTICGAQAVTANNVITTKHIEQTIGKHFDLLEFGPALVESVRGY
jgi:hypothetical protein